MATEPKHDPISTRSPNSDKAARRDSKGGNNVGNARKWGGGSKGSKGALTDADRKNENSRARS